MADLARARKTRGGHRGYLTKILAQAKELLELDDESGEGKDNILHLKESILDALKNIQKLDDEIVGLIANDEDSEEGDITREIEESARLKTDARKSIRKMEKKLCASSNAGSSDGATARESGTSASKVRAKIPKLEVKRFKGNVCKWQEFWDSFESSVHRNDELSDVDKFNYLRGLVEEPARSCIAGFSLTADNYLSAVEILKERYGKKSAVQRAHIQKLLKCERVKDEKDLQALRRVCDRVEIHYRGLQALGVEKNTYSTIVVPHILDCLPESVRLLITRGEEFHEWDVEDLLKPLKKEIELREEQNEQVERKSSRDYQKMNRSSAHSFLTKSKVDACAFCLGNHRHEECDRVKDGEKRKELLRKYSHCFNCMKKGHRARNCSSKVKCKLCKLEHHTALCDQGKVHDEQPQGTEVVEEDGKVSTTTLVVSPKHSVVRPGSKVALQTAQAMVVGQKSGRVRVLLDSGSQRSFVTVKKAKALGCEVVRKENLSIGTFGQNRASDSELRSVVRLDLKSLSCDEVVSVEAYVVPEISVIRNQHLEVVRDNFEHLKGLWLSDVCKPSEDLEVDVLVGADYLHLHLFKSIKGSTRH